MRRCHFSPELRVKCRGLGSCLKSIHQTVRWSILCQARVHVMAGSKSVALDNACTASARFWSLVSLAFAWNTQYSMLVMGPKASPEVHRVMEQETA